jgi:putative ABC transport system permease protein
LIGKWNHLHATDVEQIKRRIDGISNITPVLMPAIGTIHNGVNTTASTVFGTTSYYQQSNQVYPRFGRFINDNDNDTRHRVAVLGEKARIDLKLPQNPVGQFIQVGNEWFKIVGTMESRGEILGISLDNYVIIPYSTGLALSSSTVEPNMNIQLTVDDAAGVDAAKTRIDLLLRRTHRLGKGDEDDFKVQTSESLIGTVSRVSSMITVVVAAIVGISLLVGGVGIMNIMLVSVTERTREIGIAKALGAPRRFILTQFLIEAMLLAVIGGLIGIGIGYLFSLLAAAIIPGFPSPVTPWWAIAGATGFSALVGIVFGMLPARKAANLAPIDALRHE